MALPGNGITISLVRNTLGENKNDVGQLCTSNRINQWSFYKPVTKNKLIMTDADFYSVNDGFTCQSYNNAIDCWNACVNGETWTYQTAEAPWRLGDFRWYDHYANPWINCAFMNQGQAKKGESRLIENTGSMDFAQIYNNFPYFSPIQNPGGNDVACIGFLLNPSWTGNESSVYFYRVCSTLDYDSKRLPFTVPSDLNSYDCTYRFIPVITTYMQTQDGYCSYHSLNNPDMVNSTWFALPSNFFSLYLKNENYTPTPAFTFSVDIPWVMFDYTFPQITNLEGVLDFSISEAKTYPITVSAEIKYTNSASPVTVYNGGGTIAAGSTSLTNNWSYKNTITVAANLKDDSQLPLTVNYSYSYLGNSFSGTTTIIAERTDNPK